MLKVTTLHAIGDKAHTYKHAYMYVLSIVVVTIIWTCVAYQLVNYYHLYDIIGKLIIYLRMQSVANFTHTYI